MTLGKVIFSRSLEIEVDQLSLYNDIKDVDVLEEDKLTGTIGIWTNDLTIHEGVTIEAPKIVLFANDSLIIKEEVELKSSIKNECYLETDGNKKLY
jgi:hypothetical protein